MPASDYNKADVVAFGDAIGELVSAVRGNGVGTHAFDELIATLTTAGSAVNEMKDVPEAAAEHILGSASMTMGDHALARALAAETPTPE